MKRIAIFVAGALAIGVVTHVAAIWATPRLITARIVDRAANGATDVFMSPPLSTASWRSIVRPSPDLAYSICIVDLSKGPVRIVVPLTEPYTSVALYAPSTDNYFARNDRDSGGKDLDLIVTPPGASDRVAPPPGADIVEAPSTEGIVLVRRVVASPEAFPALDLVRKKATCAPFRR